MNISDVINYGVRILIILLGIILLSGVFMPEGSDPTMMRIFGIVFILFGFYRLALYRANRKRYKGKE